MTLGSEQRHYDVGIFSMWEVISDARTLKLSLSLQHADLSVARICPRTSLTEPTFETPGGQTPIIRLQAAPLPSVPLPESGKAGSEPTTPQVEAPAPAPVQPAYLSNLRSARFFLGRLRYAWLLYKAFAAYRFDTIIACDLDGLLVGALLKRFRGCRLVWDAKELWVDMHTGASPVFRWLFGAAESLLAPYADAVITVNRHRADVLKKRHPRIDPYVVINSPMSRASGVTPVHAPVRILYLGVFIPDRGLLELIGAMTGLRGRALLTMQGMGNFESRLKEEVVTRGLEDVVTFPDPVAPDALVAKANQHDVGFVCYRPDNLNNQLAASNKIYDYMAAGIAIVSSRLPTTEDVVEAADCGALFDHPTEEEIGDALRAVLDEPRGVAALKRNAWEAGEAYLWIHQEPVLIAAVLGGPAA